jgi:hypothetical protein
MVRVMVHINDLWNDGKIYPKDKPIEADEQLLRLAKEGYGDDAGNPFVTFLDPPGWPSVGIPIEHISIEEIPRESVEPDANLFAPLLSRLGLPSIGAPEDADAIVALVNGLREKNIELEKQVKTFKAKPKKKGRLKKVTKKGAGT